MSKDLIITGVAGDSTTGDNLFTGGNKINAMFSELYNAFAKQGANPQNIHATGYYQTPARAYYTFPIEAGAQLNVDTRNGALTVKLPNGKIGEMVKLRDIYGNWATSPVTVQADGLEKIDGSVAGVTFNVAFVEVIFRCISDTQGNVNWTYSLKSIMDRDLRLVDKTFIVTPGAPVNYTLGTTAAFTSAKLLVTGLQQVGGTAATSSEIHIVHDGTTHVYTESSVLGTGSSRVYDIDFSIQSGSVVMTLTTTLTQAKVMVRSTDYTRITL